MANLGIDYLGLKLKNPLIAGSSGLTNSLKGVVELEKNGIAAVVLKSVFEEQITAGMNLRDTQGKYEDIYPEARQYLGQSTELASLDDYLKLISDCKNTVKIPVIASINCISSQGWQGFAHQIEKAGADAIELNLFFLPTDFTRTADDNESLYFEVIDAVRKNVTIPVSLKIGYHFSNLAQMIQKLSFTGISGLVLFNRTFSPDFDIEELNVIPANLLSTPSELTVSLRWIAVMAGRVRCDLAASTGIHDGQAVIKQLLAGATATQLVSTLYINGLTFIKQILMDVESWMNAHGYASIDDYRGRLSQQQSSDPAAFERVQFMKYFSQLK